MRTQTDRHRSVKAFRRPDRLADPQQPTEARPGSPEKIEVLRLRYASGVPLWHPRDRTDHSPPDTRLPAPNRSLPGGPTRGG